MNGKLSFAQTVVPPGSSSRRDLTRRTFLSASALSATSLLIGRLGLAGEKVWRVGVIGHSGHGDYGHGLDTMWRNVPGTRVVAFADASESGRNREQMKLPDTNAYADYHEMLQQERPDIVAVGPRAIDEHHEMILAAIASGAKGVYCEKPFCRTPQEAENIVAAADRSGCRVAIAHRNRYHPALPQVKAAIEEGVIGELLEIRGRGKEDHRGGGLDLWVLGSHVFDIARYLAGDALACSAVIQQGDRVATPDDVTEGGEGVGPIAGDRLHARFDMANGLPFYFDSIRDRGVRKANFGLQLIGNQGVIDVRIDMQPLAHLLPGNPFHPTPAPRTWIPISSAGVGKPETIADVGAFVASHQAAGEDLLAAIAEERDPLCSAKDGLAIIEMINAVFASHVQNGERVALPLKNRQNPLSSWGKSS